jgi:hypothetical protein
MSQAVSRLTVGACLTRLGALEAAKARIEARQVEYLARLWDNPPPVPTAEGARHIEQEQLAQLSITAEVAVQLRISHDTAAGRLRQASRLVNSFGNTFAAVQAGEISMLHAINLLDATASLDPEVAAAVEKRVLEKAPSQTPAEFRRTVRKAVAKLDPRDAEQKHEAAVDDRRVSFEPAPDAMAWVNAYLAAHSAQTVYLAIQIVADKLKADDVAAGIPLEQRRCADQYRADALELISQAVLDGADLGALRTSAGTAPGSGRKGRRAWVQVTVALSTLLGLDDQPGELAGYGPIPAPVARKLAGDPGSTWHRLVHDDVGDLIDYGRRTYRPPQDLIDHVTARDQTCRGPGCLRDSRTCDLDHVRDWAFGGVTSAGNLAPECRRHHHLKHDCGWTVQRQPDGTYRWVSPSGQSVDKPPDQLPEDTTLQARPDDDPPPF